MDISAREHIHAQLPGLAKGDLGREEIHACRLGVILLQRSGTVLLRDAADVLSEEVRDDGLCGGGRVGP